MAAIIILALATAALSIAVPMKHHSNDLICPICEPEYCPKIVDECPRGTVNDPCGCCPIGTCQLKEGDRCLYAEDIPAISKTDLGKYGSCGEKMECLKRMDIEPEKENEYFCACLDDKQVCGSDNKTYDNSCILATMNDVWVVHSGQCDSPPEIAAGPEDMLVSESHSLALDCEVKGYPVPSVSWKFQTAGGDTKILPGDDTSVIVQTRGGPEIGMLTSWVQIISVRPEDAGNYICVASNRHGTARAVSSVRVHTVF